MLYRASAFAAPALAALFCSLPALASQPLEESSAQSGDAVAAPIQIVRPTGRVAIARAGASLGEARHPGRRDNDGPLGVHFSLFPSVERGIPTLPSALPILGARLTSQFGERYHPILGRRLLHQGVDLAAPKGTPVVATIEGVVISAGWQGAYGLTVRVRHAGGLETRYAHLSQVEVRPGETIARGQVVGRVGSTGRSTGPHLHYEVRRFDKAIDPLGGL